MIQNDGNISQSRIKETSYFVSKLTNFGLFIEKYYFGNENQTINL